MRIVLTRSFERDYRDLPERLKQDVQKIAGLVVSNHRHPSLRAKKMKPKTLGTYEVRISKGYRMTFSLDGDKIIVRRVGSHDVLRKP